MTKTLEQLNIENEELRSRLSENEEMLLAMQNGEVDAIVISGAKGEQVYSLSSAETPYRTFVEEMQGGAVTLTKGGLILYCNTFFADLLQKPFDEVIGSYITSYITTIDRLSLDNLLSEVTDNKNGTLILSLVNSTWLKLSVQLIPAYLQGDNIILIATDITELKKKEMELTELHRQLKLKMAQLQDLRIEIINARIKADAANKKLEKTIESLLVEKRKLEQTRTELRLKLKGMRITL